MILFWSIILITVKIIGMEYEVICISVYNGSVVIDAPSAEDAVNKAQK